MALDVLKPRTERDLALEALIHRFLCVHLQAVRRFTEASEHGRQTVQALRDLTEQHTSASTNDLASVYVDLSHSLAQEGKPKESLEALRECCLHLETRFSQRESARHGHELGRELAIANGNLMSRLEGLPGGPAWDEIEHLSRRNREICEKILFLYPKDGTLHYYHAISCFNISKYQIINKLSCNEILNSLEQSRKSMALAIEYKPGLEFGNDQALTEDFVMISQALEVALRGSGRTKDADDLAAGTRRLWKGKPALIYEAACELSKMIPQIPGETASDLSRKDLYVRLCIDTLREAVANGFINSDQLRGDKRLEPVRFTESFQELIRGLKAQPSSPKAA